MKGFYRFIASNTRFQLDLFTARNLAGLAYGILQGDLPFNPELFTTPPADETHAQRAVEFFGPPEKTPGVSAVREIGNESSPNAGERVNILVYPIRGVMFMEDQVCGPKGMQTIAKQLTRYSLSGAFDAIVLDVCSPGGEAFYSTELAETIRDISERMPVIGWVNQMAFSAAYKIIAPTTEILLANNVTQVGSIGTQISYYDFSRKWEKEGIDYVQIVSDSSPDKNALNFDQPTDDDKALIRKELVNPFAKNFQDYVKAQRNPNTETLTGKLYYPDQAIKFGLADGIATLDEAIQRAANLTVNYSKSNQMETEAKTAVELNKEIDTLTNQVTEKDKSLGEKDQEIQDLRDQVNTLTQEKDQLQKDKDEELKTLQDQVKNLTEENKKLGSESATEAKLADQLQEEIEDKGKTKYGPETQAAIDRWEKRKKKN